MDGIRIFFAVEKILKKNCVKPQKGVYLHKIKPQKGVYLHKIKPQKGV